MAAKMFRIDCRRLRLETRWNSTTPSHPSKQAHSCRWSSHKVPWNQITGASATVIWRSIVSGRASPLGSYSITKSIRFCDLSFAPSEIFPKTEKQCRTERLKVRNFWSPAAQEGLKQTTAETRLSASLASEKALFAQRFWGLVRRVVLKRTVKWICQVLPSTHQNGKGKPHLQQLRKTSMLLGLPQAGGPHPTFERCLQQLDRHDICWDPLLRNVFPTSCRKQLYNLKSMWKYREKAIKVKGWPHEPWRGQILRHLAAQAYSEPSDLTSFPNETHKKSRLWRC